MVQEDLMKIGIGLIVIGFLAIVIGSLFSKEKADVKYSFVGFIGPFPFGFGNDKRLMVFSLILAIVIFVLLYLFFKR